MVLGMAMRRHSIESWEDNSDSIPKTTHAIARDFRWRRARFDRIAKRSFDKEYEAKYTLG
jgi:hypothetical protein